MSIGQRVRQLSTGRIGMYIGTPAVFGHQWHIVWYDTGETSQVHRSEVEVIPVGVKLVN
jgi:hypothetical protein